MEGGGECAIENRPSIVAAHVDDSQPEEGHDRPAKNDGNDDVQRTEAVGGHGNEHSERHAHTIDDDDHNGRSGVIQVQDFCRIRGNLSSQSIFHSQQRISSREDKMQTYIVEREIVGPHQEEPTTHVQVEDRIPESTPVDKGPRFPWGEARPHKYRTHG